MDVGTKAKAGLQRAGEVTKEKASQVASVAKDKVGEVGAVAVPEEQETHTTYERTQVTQGYLLPREPPQEKTTEVTSSRFTEAPTRRDEEHRTEGL